MFVPVLGEACLHVALVHVKDLPMNLCTLTTDEDSECDVEHSARVVQAVDAVRVERICRNYLLDELVLLF